MDGILNIENCLMDNFWLRGFCWFRFVQLDFGSFPKPQKVTSLHVSNSKFAPEYGWLEDNRFLLGPGLFSGAK